MQEVSKSHKARIAIRTFKVLADALTLRGYYKPAGKTGLKLADSLKAFSPEIYGSMSDPRIVELKGLEYVIDRMPRGIEKCNRIILTAKEDFENTSFARVFPRKRRRACYIVSEKEICFIITRGLTEIYDILTHITFLNIESQKLFERIGDKSSGINLEWLELEKVVSQGDKPLEGAELDQAIWNISIILGRTYKETRDAYENIETSKKEGDYNSGFFQIIYELGQRIYLEQKLEEEQLTIYFTPSLHEMIGHHQYASSWAENIKKTLYEQGLHERPIHIISANMHSVKNLLYGYAALKTTKKSLPEPLYEMISAIKEEEEVIDGYAQEHGLTYLEDTSGSNIDVHLIDTAKIDFSTLRPEIIFDSQFMASEKPVIVVIDYAFGTQAFQVMDELLGPYSFNGSLVKLNYMSISIMGKAGILPGNKGDIMLATAHVMEGTPHNYIVNNDLRSEDFDDSVNVYCGPMLTVLGTSLQNKDVLQRFYCSSWKAIGLEMEGAHFQRAISAAVIQGNIESDMKTRYAYYASDNPLKSGQTLASGSMGEEGIAPTYMITKVLLNRIMHPRSS
jgi:hypothetical protein